MMAFNRIIPLLACILAVIIGINGHGYLWNPPSRSTMWRQDAFRGSPVNTMDNQLSCGGAWTQNGINGGKCGICGDPYQGPRDNEAGGKYATGVITKHYQAGQTISVEVRVTANHGGWFEFRICPNNNPKKPATEECLNQNLLKRPDGSTRYQIHGEDGGRLYTVQLQLPRGLTCTQCVLQWKWNTASSWGCETQNGIKHCGKGFGPQENFMGCADVAVSGSSISAPGFGVNPKPTVGQGHSNTNTNFHPVGGSGHGGNNNQNTHTTGCMATAAWRAVYPLADQWCQTNCPYNCPSQCERSCLTTTTTTRRTTVFNNIRPGGGLAPIVPILDCVATPLWKSMYSNADSWCKTNCARSVCPSNYCGSGCRVYRKAPILG